jgi:hypothetical protein
MSGLNRFAVDGSPQKSNPNSHEACQASVVAVSPNSQLCEYAKASGGGWLAAGLARKPTDWHSPHTVCDEWSHSTGRILQILHGNIDASMGCSANAGA